ncbi:MAG: tetratricopeptide repeat protein [Gemmataceae bacterium]
MDGPHMRKINGKLFLLLLLGGVLSVVGVFAVHAFQYQRIGQALLFQARRADEQGQKARSAQYLQRYLEFNPRDVDERTNLARLWAGDAYPPGSRARGRAIKEMDDLLRQKDDPELRRLLVKIAVEQMTADSMKLARDHLQRLLPWQEVENWLSEEKTARQRGKAVPEFMTRENRERGELEFYWGQVLESETKPAEAIACYRFARQHAPQVHLSFIRLAHLLRRYNETDVQRRQKNLEEADAAIDDLVRTNSDGFESYLARWRYRRDFNLLKITEAAGQGKLDLDEAAEDVAQALKRGPESMEVLLAAADLERLRGRIAFDDSERTPAERRTALRDHRRRALDYLKRGEDLAANKKTPAGDASLFQMLWHRGNLLLDDLDLQRMQQEDNNQPVVDQTKLKDEVGQLVARVRKAQMPAAADYMQARLLVVDRRWGDAAVLFERARAELASQRDLACQADLYLGHCYERLEEPTQMFNAFKRVLEFDPNSTPAMLGMAAARWSQGQLDNALAQYQVVMSQKRVPVRAWVDIGRLELQRQVQNPTPDWTQLEKILKAAREANSEQSLELNLLQAELLVRQGRLEDSRKLLEAARLKDNGEPEYVVALIDLALRGKDTARARTLLQEGRRTLEDRVTLRLAESRIVQAEQGAAASAAIANLAAKRNHFSEEDQSRLLAGLADTLFRAGQTGEARKLWQAMASLPTQRTDLRLQLLLFDLAMKEGDDAGMKKLLTDIQDIEKNSGAYHRYGEALYRIWKARKALPGEERTSLVTEARRLLDGVLAQRPGWSAVFLARADISEMIGNPEQAIKDLQEAMKTGENSPSILRRLVTLLTQRGRDAEAQVLLAKLHQSVLYNTDLGKLAVTVAVRRNETGRAVEMMRQAVREDTRDPADLVWMARVLAAAGPAHAAEAEKRLQAAIEVASGDPAPWLAMVQFQMSQKRRDDARATLAKAREKLPADRQALTLARCYEMLGDVKESQTFYRQALEQSPNDPRIVRTVANAHLLANRGAEAEPLLRQLAEGKVPGALPADVDWSRRSLAMLLASSTDYRRFTEALKLVGLVLDSNGRLPREEPREESTEERRARARVLASQNQKQFRERAIVLFQDLARARALTPDDEFILAMLYDAEGESRKSQQVLEQLTQPKTRTPQYLAQYVMSLIVQRRLPEDLAKAETMIGWLEELERQREVGPNGFASVEMKTRLLEARGKGDEALALIKQHVSRPGARPEEMLLVMASMSRLKRYKEAFALCEKTWQEGRCPPEAIGGISVSLLRVMNPSDAQVALIEKHLQAAQAKNPTSVVLLMHLSDLYDQRGQYDRAAEAYRAVLQQEPNNVVALNNLAWLLAHRSGEAKLALEYINKAVNGMGRRADLLDTRGVVHMALKDTAQALADLREATADGPTPVRLFHLARAYHEERDTTRARETLRQAHDKGLQVSSLHPVEQESARRLLQEYGVR